MNYRHVIALTVVVCALSGAATTAEEADEASPLPIVRLWPTDPPATQPYDATDNVIRRSDGGYTLTNVQRPSLSVHLPATQTPDLRPRAAVIICPGGGYAHMSVTHEGTRVAEAFAEQGVVGFVLRYRMPDGQAPASGALPAPQQDVLRAIQTVRSRAAEWGVDPQRIGVIGFSAGGHLAATAATLFDQADSFAGKSGDDAISKVSARPDFAVLMYPVITMDPNSTHRGSRDRLIGSGADADTIARFSAEQQITPNTPPLLIIHAEDDRTVKPANALLMATAAAEHRVPCTLILPQSGGHGFGMGTPGTDSATWLDQALAWLTARELLN